MTTVGELTPDHLIISCHKNDEHKKLIRWDKQKRCSCCLSMHPDEFVVRLTRDFMKGWHWVGVPTVPGGNARKKPEVCRFDGAKFVMDHLRDMPLSWLRLHRRTIAEYTGVVFYWKKETLKWKRVTKDETLKRGYTFTPQELEVLEKTLKRAEEIDDNWD